MMRTFVEPLLAILMIAAPLLINTAQSQIQASAGEQVKVTARYHIENGSDQGFLIAKLEIPEGSYVYSMTQAKPLTPSKLAIKPSKEFVVGKTFKSDKKPKVVENDPLFQARLEKHTGTVQFYVPIRMANVKDLKTIQPEVTFSGQVCSDEGYCTPVKGIIAKAKFAGFFEREAKNSVPPLQQRK